MENLDAQMTDTEELYSALEAMEFIAARQQAEIDRLRKVERAAQLLLAVVELEPWRLAYAHCEDYVQINASLAKLRGLLL